MIPPDKLGAPSTPRLCFCGLGGIEQPMQGPFRTPTAITPQGEGPEGGGGFQPPHKVSESTRALAPERCPPLIANRAKGRSHKSPCERSASLRRRQCLRHALSLRKERLIIRPARLGVRPAHIETAKRVRAHHRPRTLAVEVKISHVELKPGAIQAFPVGRVDRAG